MDTQAPRRAGSANGARTTRQSAAAKSASMELSLALDLPAESGRHVVTLDVFDPEGKWMPYHRKRLAVGAQGVSARVPVAFNAPLGKWTVRAIEVITGQVVEKPVRVTE